jgi:hypothetical protein
MRQDWQIHSDPQSIPKIVHAIRPKWFYLSFTWNCPAQTLQNAATPELNWLYNLFIRRELFFKVTHLRALSNWQSPT